ncbi:nuclear transport factor 2 family protein [Nocardioides islandensis]|jgi:hypothetical protein|uniref:Nuclear transport factor 2 family protein n=1 Tax=Nocardioides islandensis TaxID=433663 RepID=A0A930VA65_9ACTN|nr:nuclear transport factor 2 family protein [Nocardioides islandensis]MBF4761851.1 nuclear transport factor 2 family protein [Nocardioides islandensis]
MTTTHHTTAARERRAAEVRRHLEVVGVDLAAEHEVYHPDAVLEFPQSRERFEGLATIREWRGRYPANVRLRPTRIVGDGDVWVGFGRISYDGGVGRPCVAVLEYRGDLVERETIHVTDSFEAPEWRAAYTSPYLDGA